MLTVKAMIYTYLQTLCPVVFVVMILVSNPIDGNHQGWLSQATCPCKPAGTLARTVLKLYRGLFVKPTEVYDLPVIKPVGGRSETQGNLTTYTVHTVTSKEKKIPSCCNTEYAFEIFNKTDFNKRILKVVHFQNAYQFVPTGICPPKTKCGQGDCIQRYRHHWLLVWDDTLQHYPPVTFIPVEIPSHCECANVGS
ncbi:uncharacterized protein LOC134240479 [Saccostrea cucullata]|uniref:uncharacterized protein LOC134240479 n=1 Tax=Saccostrea cuccullata TaxID=36930 RepID=UPI002ED1D34F